MSRIKIITDSTCDLNKDILVKRNIAVIPLSVTFGEEVYRDGVDITTAELYKLVDEKNALPKTSAISPGEFMEVFSHYVNENQQVLYIGISSKISCTYNNALLAKADFPTDSIEVIDSCNLSTGIGLLVLKACDLADQNYSLQEIAAIINHMTTKTKTAFIIDSLEYLHKGGRCSAMQSVVSGILKIKPMISVVDGGMIVREKIRGKREKGLTALLKLIENTPNLDLKRISITHSFSDEDALYLKEEIKNKYNFQEIMINNAGCVISSHCGKNTIGIIFFIKD